jgi:hypothetical protein
MSRLEVCSIIFQIVCFVGFLVHSVTFSINYFQYKTSTSLVIEVRHKISAPDVGYCSRWTDIIDRSNALKYGLKTNRSNDLNDVDDDLSALTLDQIFELTPPENETIYFCHYRTGNDNDVALKYGQNCSQFFRVQKFFMQNFMCYAIFVSKIDYTFSRIAHSLRFPFKFYSIALKEKVAAGHEIAVMGFLGRLPYISRDFAASYRRYKDFEKNVDGMNNFFLRYSHNNVSQLPSPYDTNCSPREFFEKNNETCKATCLKERLRSLERSPVSEILIQGSRFKPIGPKDVFNKTLNGKIEKIENHCDSVCPLAPCNYEYAVTHSHSFHQMENKNPGVILRIMIPKTPSLHTLYYPKTSFWEYALYIMSTFGVWLGMSAVALNPFKRFIDIREKKLQDPRKVSKREVKRLIERSHHLRQSVEVNDMRHPIGKKN